MLISTSARITNLTPCEVVFINDKGVIARADGKRIHVKQSGTFWSHKTLEV